MAKNKQTLAILVELGETYQMRRKLPNDLRSSIPDYGLLLNH